MLQRGGGLLLGWKGPVLPLNEWEEKTAVLLREGDHDVAVLGLYNARFREGQIQALRELERQGRPLVVVLLGAPSTTPRS